MQTIGLAGPVVSRRTSHLAPAPLNTKNIENSWSLLNPSRRMRENRETTKLCQDERFCMTYNYTNMLARAHDGPKDRATRLLRAHVDKLTEELKSREHN